MRYEGTKDTLRLDCRRLQGVALPNIEHRALTSQQCCQAFEGRKNTEITVATSSMQRLVSRRQTYAQSNARASNTRKSLQWFHWDRKNRRNQERGVTDINICLKTAYRRLIFFHSLSLSHTLFFFISYTTLSTFCQPFSSSSPTHSPDKKLRKALVEQLLRRMDGRTDGWTNEPANQPTRRDLQPLSQPT